MYCLRYACRTTEIATIGRGIFLIRAQHRREIRETEKFWFSIFNTNIYLGDWLIKSVSLVQISSLQLFKVSFTD